MYQQTLNFINLRIKSNLFQCNSFASSFVFCLVNNSVCSFSDFFNSVKSIHYCPLRPKSKQRVGSSNFYFSIKPLGVKINQCLKDEVKRTAFEYLQVKTLFKVNSLCWKKSARRNQTSTLRQLSLRPEVSSHKCHFAPIHFLDRLVEIARKLMNKHFID